MGALALHGDFLVAHPGLYTSQEVAAAIQVAIWDVEYGTTFFTYDTLGSPIDAAPPGTSGLVGRYLALVGTGNPWDEYFGTLVFAAAGNQTLLWAPEPSIGPTIAIPEPSTWAMMLLGFAGLGYAGFRKAKAKAALA